ncbi:kinase-like protein [Canariomyces notabilis]|uniref:Kinase-like protein n=1 Tax=Canariomyces notabilis TaxID=2074819 RepID=A0AAN6TID0_9PEZI|nr:kinase-like protein [Canariomyces arenarius]
MNVLLGLHFLHSYGIVHGDLHMGNILANIHPLGQPLDDGGALERNLQQLASQGCPLKRKDGKTDLWAPAYLLELAPLHEQVCFDLDPAVKITDLGTAFFEEDPPPKIVTPVHLRAPETILGGPSPPGKGIDIWSFGCLMLELLTTRYLCTGLEGVADDEEYGEYTNDEHVIQLSEVLGPLPEELASRWRRRDRYYGPDGKRLDMPEPDQDGDGDQDEHERRGDDGIGIRIRRPRCTLPKLTQIVEEWSE